MPDPLGHHGGLHWPIVGQPLIAFDIPEDEQSLSLLGYFDAIGRDEIELKA